MNSLDPASRLAYGAFTPPEDLTAWSDLEVVDGMLYFYPAVVDSMIWVRVRPPDPSTVYERYRNPEARAEMDRRAVELARRFLRFCVVSVSAMLLNTLIMYVAVEGLQWHYLLGLLVVLLVVPPYNFFLNLLWSYRPE